MDVDLGDIVASFNLRVKGARRLHWRLRVGPVTTMSAKEMQAIRNATASVASVIRDLPERKVDRYMDLLDDQKVKYDLQWTDDAGNEVPAPDPLPGDFAATYSVTDSSVLALTDNGDGTAVVASTGTLGSAGVHVEVTADGQTLTGDDEINVVTSAAARITLKAGTPEHV